MMSTNYSQMIYIIHVPITYGKKEGRMRREGGKAHDKTNGQILNSHPGVLCTIIVIFC